MRPNGIQDDPEALKSLQTWAATVRHPLEFHTVEMLAEVRGLEEARSRCNRLYDSDAWRTMLAEDEGEDFLFAVNNWIAQSLGSFGSQIALIPDLDDPLGSHQFAVALKSSLFDVACFNLAQSFIAKERIETCQFCGGYFAVRGVPDDRSGSAGRRRYCTRSCGNSARQAQFRQRLRKKGPSIA